MSCGCSGLRYAAVPTIISCMWKLGMLTGETQGIVAYVDGQVANKSEYFERGGFSVAAPGGPAVEGF